MRNFFLSHDYKIDDNEQVYTSPNKIQWYKNVIVSKYLFMVVELKDNLI